jgi:hypothetical protein
MNDLSEGPGLQATMALQFVERDGRIFMIFEAGLGERLIEIWLNSPCRGNRKGGA